MRLPNTQRAKSTLLVLVLVLNTLYLYIQQPTRLANFDLFYHAVTARIEPFAYYALIPYVIRWSGFPPAVTLYMVSAALWGMATAFGAVYLLRHEPPGYALAAYATIMPVSVLKAYGTEWSTALETVLLLSAVFLAEKRALWRTIAIGGVVALAALNRPTAVLIPITLWLLGSHWRPALMWTGIAVGVHLLLRVSIGDTVPNPVYHPAMIWITNVKDLRIDPALMLVSMFMTVLVLWRIWRDWRRMAVFAVWLTPLLVFGAWVELWRLLLPILAIVLVSDE